MAETYTGKRVLFPKGEQQKFLNKVLTNISVGETAKVCGLSKRTIRDWRREKFLMDANALKILCRRFNIASPPNTKLQDRYWYVTRGASKGGRAIIEKYGRVGGDPEYRIKKWREWWDNGGKQKFALKRFSEWKPVKKPKYSEDLAEFVGIILGDGGISDYQITVTLHAVDDKEYGYFVVDLIKRLFDVPVGIHRNKSAAVFNYVVSRIELVRFCTKKLGLKKGSKVKQQVDIPDWIKRNKKYLVSCVRGLVDTDGCVFTHKYKVKNKEYSYKKLSFTNHSEPLRQSVFRILNDLGIRVRLDNSYDVRIDSKEDMTKYFRVVGSHNPKHLKRYQN